MILTGLGDVSKAFRDARHDRLRTSKRSLGVSRNPFGECGCKDAGATAKQAMGGEVKSAVNLMDRVCRHNEAMSSAWPAVQIVTRDCAASKPSTVVTEADREEFRG